MRRQRKRRAHVARSMEVMGCTPQLINQATNRTSVTLRFMPAQSICPDLLGLDYLGDADTWRGRTVRGFFWAMRLWPKPKAKGKR